MAPIVAGELPSYKDLPVNLYQVEWKYRDECRPRFGILRAREFLMKDAYSFDRDEDGMRASYRVMYEAYRRMFDRCGLDYVIVEADPGRSAADVNHEFMARAEVGEDLFVECENGDYLADWRPRRRARPSPPRPTVLAPLDDVHTPDARDDRAVAAQLGIGAERTLKMHAVRRGSNGSARRGRRRARARGPRGERDEAREAATFPPSSSRFEDADFARLGFAKGYVGPQGFGEDVTVLADHSVRGGIDWVTGRERARTPRDGRERRP